VLAGRPELPRVPAAGQRADSLQRLPGDGRRFTSGDQPAGRARAWPLVPDFPADAFRGPARFYDRHRQQTISFYYLLA
jgi:hypothetical protein